MRLSWVKSSRIWLHLPGMGDSWTRHPKRLLPRRSVCCLLPDGNNLQSNMLRAKAALGAESKQRATLVLPASLGKGRVWFGKFPLPAFGKTKWCFKKAFSPEVRRRIEQVLCCFSFHENTKDKPFKQFVNSADWLQGALRLLQALNSGIPEAEML